MAGANAARREGDSFQARVFWRKAINLLDPQSPVTKVGFESGPKGFDDVWVAYDGERAPIDHEGHAILREHIQCKWHVTVSDFGFADLTLPDWINANKVSLLQRAHLAQCTQAPAGIGVRFKLLTNWRVGQTDPLRALITQRSKTLRMRTLFDGTTDRSKTGQIRKLWRDHLGIDDESLQYLARVLALDTDSTSLDDIRETLDTLFELRGLRRIPSNESSFPYDDIAFQWLSQGRLEFSRADFKEACKKEGLLVGDSKIQVAFGVKSFEHSIDRLEDRCTSVLNLVPEFDDRAIRDQEAWERGLHPMLINFLQMASSNNDVVRLALDVHVTLAFAAGSILNIKCGRHIEIEQRTLGRNLWTADDEPQSRDWPSWHFDVKTLDDCGEGIAVAVSLTHDIDPAVMTHLLAKRAEVGKVLIARPSCGPGGQSVVCGRHAFQLAEQLAAKINVLREGRSATLHIFIAAPNAFTFFLGQRQAGLGRTTLYEYDFEARHGGGYQSSLTFPVDR